MKVNLIPTNSLMNDDLVVQTFSSGYRIVQSAEVYEVDEGEAIMDADMLDRLREMYDGQIVGKVDNLHYQFKPRRSIPRFGVAVPSRNHNDPDTLLIKK
jgi:hypothetical protein